MFVRNNYLEVREKAYQKILREKQASWSNDKDFWERLNFYLSSLIEVQPKAKVLVLGSRDGEECICLSKLGFKVAGLDKSPSAIHWSKKKAKVRETGTFFFEKDALDLEDLGLVFDVVIDNHLLECMTGADRKKLLSQISMVLKKGGEFLVRTQCSDISFEDREFISMWDVESQRRVQQEISRCYLEQPEKILAEVEKNDMQIISKKMIQKDKGRFVLEICLKNDSKARYLSPV